MESLIVKSFLKKKFGVNMLILLGVRRLDELKAHAWYGRENEHEFIKIIIP